FSLQLLLAGAERVNGCLCVNKPRLQYPARKVRMVDSVVVSLGFQTERVASLEVPAGARVFAVQVDARIELHSGLVSINLHFQIQLLEPRCHADGSRRNNCLQPRVGTCGSGKRGAWRPGPV